jgi:hypothetical protein
MTRVHLGLTVFILASSLSWAGPPVAPQKISGIYSDLAYNSESGDLGGMELLVIPGGEDKNGLIWRAFFQLAEGGAPYSTVVTLVVHGTALEFTLPPGDELAGLHFTGTISNTEIVLNTPAGQVEHLRRGKSYWQ